MKKIPLGKGLYLVSMTKKEIADLNQMRIRLGRALSIMESARSRARDGRTRTSGRS